ncbi:MAG TPA: hypothetical protein VHG93_24580 [Longimicrobium sp.]|nr:hypothetical protein [Longimicrobium sp.]
MAAESSRRPRDERMPPADGDPSADTTPASDGGETLAEKIRRYRQPGQGAFGGAPVPGGRVVRKPRDE